MGVDIYGISPKLTAEKPEMPDNYNELSEEETDKYWEKYNQWEQDNPGYYFRNNWWHWRPLQMLISVFNEVYNMNIPENEIKSLGSNDGSGVSDKSHCEQLASYFKEFVVQMKADGAKAVYLNTGWWHFADKSLSPKSIEDEALVEALNNKYPGLFFEEPEYNGIKFEASHATSIDNLEEFALFLENCNGFKIY